MDAYRTIEGRAQAEVVEKKSRFIGQIAHVQTEDEALAFLEEVRTLHAQARHNVYAYVLRGGRVRYSDDGEPGGTAGMPTLQAMQHAGLVDVACVVTRYFGGTLLGTGGLVRAYTQATQAAIEAACIVQVSRCVDVQVQVPYPQYEQVLRLAESTGAAVQSSAFAEDVALVLRCLDGRQAPLLQGLSELLRGQVDVRESEPFDAAF